MQRTWDEEEDGRIARETEWRQEIETYKRERDELMDGTFILIIVWAIGMTSCVLCTAAVAERNRWDAEMAAERTHVIAERAQWEVERAALVSAAEAAASKSEVSLFLILVWAIIMTPCFVYRLRPREPPMPSPKLPPTTRGRRNGPTYSPSSTPTGEQCYQIPSNTQIPPKYHPNIY